MTCSVRKCYYKDFQTELKIYFRAADLQSNKPCNFDVSLTVHLSTSINLANDQLYAQILTL